MFLNVGINCIDSSTVYLLLKFLDSFLGSTGHTYDGRDTRIARLVVEIFDHLIIEFLCLLCLLGWDPV